MAKIGSHIINDSILRETRYSLHQFHLMKYVMKTCNIYISIGIDKSMEVTLLISSYLCVTKLHSIDQYQIYTQSLIFAYFWPFHGNQIKVRILSPANPSIILMGRSEMNLNLNTALSKLDLSQTFILSSSGNTDSGWVYITEITRSREY